MFDFYLVSINKKTTLLSFLMVNDHLHGGKVFMAWDAPGCPEIDYTTLLFKDDKVNLCPEIFLIEIQALCGLVLKDYP